MPVSRRLSTAGSTRNQARRRLSAASTAPDCLSAHLNDVAKCTQPAKTAVDAFGLGGELGAVQQAGGRFVNITPLMCTATVCPPIIGNILVYRDDNHVTTTFAKWLAPLFDAEVQATLAGRPRAAA